MKDKVRERESKEFSKIKLREDAIVNGIEAYPIFIAYK
jgi:hypothetical protein